MAYGLYAVERTRRRRRETRRPSDARVDGVMATRSREDAIAATAVRTASKTMHEDGVKDAASARRSAPRPRPAPAPRAFHRTPAPLRVSCCREQRPKRPVSTRPQGENKLSRATWRWLGKTLVASRHPPLFVAVNSRNRRRQKQHLSKWTAHTRPVSERRRSGPPATCRASGETRRATPFVKFFRQLPPS